MQVITPHPSDLGDGFMVHRALPSAARRAVGPFVFLDQFGPVQLGAGKGLDVRPQELHMAQSLIDQCHRPANDAVPMMEAAE